MVEEDSMGMEVRLFIKNKEGLLTHHDGIACRNFKMSDLSKSAATG
jgi:hypothetical protein